MTGIPYIPEQITVHLGSPDSEAENITVDFPEYIKNVASSEIYPTWPESALRANIYAIVTFALNRIYTEWYRLKGYPFSITNDTQYDQAFTYNGIIFENISRLTDELFNDYIVKGESVEPYFTAFCNGTTVTCPGLSQWGTVELASQGLTPYEILQHYFGDDIRIVKNAEVRTETPSYPGKDFSEGNISEDIKTAQLQLNRIASNYPAIHKIPEPNGFFGPETTEAVKTFQDIFNLAATGTIDKSTWYKIAYIYVSVKKLAELDSEGISLSEIPLQHQYDLKTGDEDNIVKSLQYYLAVIGAYYESVPPVSITGYFGEQTEKSVKAFQSLFGLPETGIVDLETWNDLYRAYAGIAESVPISPDTVALYPGNVLKEGVTSEYVRTLQEYLSFISQTYSDIPPVNPTGYFGPVTKSSVTAFQKRYGLPPNGSVGADTWNEIARVYSDLKFGGQKQTYQFPGYTIK